MSAPSYRRLAGVLLPLFSMRSSESWGIGEFRDLRPFSAWMREAGLSPDATPRLPGERGVARGTSILATPRPRSLHGVCLNRPSPSLTW